jgi:peroxiredoxin
MCMIELGQLEEQHEEFAKRKTRVIAVSVEDQEAARATQKDFPHLVVVADAEGNLAKALDVIQPASAPDGGDTAAPTTILIDGTGAVRWTYRPERFLVRLNAADLLAAIDKHVPRDRAAP